MQAGEALASEWRRIKSDVLDRPDPPLSQSLAIGRAIVEAINSRDYPLVMAVSFFFATMVVIGNLVADILYAVVDPRIRYE